MPLVDVPGQGSDDLIWRELRPVLDEEIARLPARYRPAVVLCYLEGASNAEAARRLGWPRGTVATRLAWARQRLRSRLEWRGITLPAGALTALLAQETAEAAISGRLAKTTVEASLRFAVGQGMTAATTSAVMLAKGVLTSMTMTKVQFAVLMVLTASVVGVGTGWLVRSLSSGERPQAVAPPSVARAEPDRNEILKEEIAVLQRELRELKKSPAAKPTPPEAKETAAADSLPLLYQGKPASAWLVTLRDRDPDYRVKGIKALDSLAQVDPSLIPAIMGSLKDNDPEVRTAAVNALGDIGSPAGEAVPLILRSGCSIQNILNALDEIDPKGQRAMPAALAVLKETEARPRQTAAFVLLHFDKSKMRLGMTGFVDAFQAEDENFFWYDRTTKASESVTVHLIAAWALEQIGSQAREAVPALVRALHSPLHNSDAVRACSSALTSVDPEGKEAIPLLIKELASMKQPLDDSDRGERTCVIRALALYGPKAKAAIPTLREIVKKIESSKHPNFAEGLHFVAIDALNKIDPKKPPTSKSNKAAKEN